jgi:hypothetical protein
VKGRELILERGTELRQRWIDPAAFPALKEIALAESRTNKRRLRVSCLNPHHRLAQDQPVDHLGLQIGPHVDRVDPGLGIAWLTGDQFIAARRDAENLEKTSLIRRDLQGSLLDLVPDLQLIRRGAGGSQLQSAFWRGRPALGRLDPTRDGSSTPQPEVTQIRLLARRDLGPPEIDRRKSTFRTQAQIELPRGDLTGEPAFLDKTGDRGVQPLGPGL